MGNLSALRAFCDAIGCPAFENEPMAAHTTLKIGGPAGLFLRPAGSAVAGQVISRAAELGVPLAYIGKGSNLLVSDAGIRGAVLSLDERQAHPHISPDDPEVVVCPAGASLTALCVFAWRSGLSGLEFAYGIPGSVGGAVCMNAGAYGGEMADVLQKVVYLDALGAPHEREDLALGYRRSWFTGHPELLVAEGVFRLKKGDPEEVHARMEDYMDRRRAKQPLEYPSAGSTFKRPEGAYASALIDQCGLKGRRVGGAMVSEKHAGFLINYENATCADMSALIELVQCEVREKTGFSLECEVKQMGF